MKLRNSFIALSTLAIITVNSMSVFAHAITPLGSTKVNMALNESLDSEGKWAIITFSDDTTQSTAGGGIGAFSDAGDPVVLNTTTKDVQVGSDVATLIGKVEIGGDANQPQLVIQANAAQTDNVFIMRNSAAAEKCTISKNGLITATGLTLGVTQNITWGTKALDHDGTDFVFNDDVSVNGLKLGSTEYITMGTETIRHDATDFLFSDTIAIPGITSTAADGEHGANFSNSGAPTGGEQETEGAFTYNRTTDKLEVWNGSDRNKNYISNEDAGNIRWLIFNLVEAATDCAMATNIAGDFESPIAGTILQSDSSPFYIKATNSTAGINTGVGLVVDVSIGGTSIMTTNKLDFDTTEKTTTTAATKPVLTITALAVGDIITIDIDSIHDGTAAKGLTVYIPVRETQ